MKKAVLAPVLVTALLLGTSLVPSTDATAAKDESLAQFNAKSSGALKVVYNKKGAPEFVTGVLSNQGGQDARAAVDFLDQHKAFFKMKNPKSDLKALKAETDSLGMTHIRLQQMKNGLPVENAITIVHIDTAGAVRTVNGDFNTDVDALNLDTTPLVSADQAIQSAVAAVDAPQLLESDPTSELVVYPFEGQTYVAHKVNVHFLGEHPGNWSVYVDAKSGQVIDQFNSIMDLDLHKQLDLKPASASGIGVNGAHRTLSVSHNNPGKGGTMFYLADYSIKGMDGILTYDFKNQWRSTTVRLPGELFTSRNASFHSDYERAAVDAHHSSKIVYDYYLNEHNRNSIDGKGMAIISTVHYGEQYNNAFWDGAQMTYGDGDGSYFISLAAGLDVAAHEMTHGVTTHSAGLRYRNQSGALNESYSDIFGALIDSDDWEMGEDIMGADQKAIGRDALRSLSNPNRFPVKADYAPYGDGSGMYPKNMSQFYNLPLSLDSGGVHVNSSIWNHGAYLIAQEIGQQKLGKIYYHTLTNYLTPDSNFRDARIATIHSAKELYGENSFEVQAVIRGLDAIGITE
ncbi:bacillolysin [Tumebacillus sp. BK434]|uniref:M4 family metallopeptidase n=1 Tax=Tumebacillus sp. BK434 TaxID=2512169 RepID=UPI001044ADB1|nr:M4 family metallopeptidase [Tumebacillus sp. BK434]TCP59258.1 bacillolysin [Tumebacillus sp. BK434]